MVLFSVVRIGFHLSNAMALEYIQLYLYQNY